MRLAPLLHRVFTGRGDPTTEDIQRRIRGYLDRHDGRAEAAALADQVMSDVPDAARDGQLRQAAQILVNRGLIRAWSGGRPVDPVHAPGDLTFTRADGPREDASTADTR